MSVNRIQTVATLMPRARTLPGAIHASAMSDFRETEGAAQVCNVDLKCKWPHLRILLLQFDFLVTRALHPCWLPHECSIVPN